MSNQPSPTQQNLSRYSPSLSDWRTLFCPSFIHSSIRMKYGWITHAIIARARAKMMTLANAEIFRISSMSLGIKLWRKRFHRHAECILQRWWQRQKGVSLSTKSQLLKWCAALLCVLHGDNFLHLPAGALILLLDRLLTAVGIEYLFYRRDTLQFHHHSIHHIG
jgi:hypothetical protein